MSYLKIEDCYHYILPLKVALHVSASSLEFFMFTELSDLFQIKFSD